jgi:hypothetical protein
MFNLADTRTTTTGQTRPRTGLYKLAADADFEAAFFALCGLCRHGEGV